MPTLVIGAGLIGMATAYALNAAGEDVIVLDRQGRPAGETSRANGSLLHPSLVEPWNSPGILKVLMRSLGREDAAVLLRMRALPSLLGWGQRFLRESSPDRYLANTLRNLRLAQHSVEVMRTLREEVGIAYHHYDRGSLTLYREPGKYLTALRWYEALSACGLETRDLDPAALVAMDGALAPVADRLAGGIFAPGDEGGDPHAFCAGLHEYLAARGVRFRFGATVERMVGSSDGISGVELTGGEVILAERVVLAGGSYSGPLVRSLGLRLPVRPVKGYSMTLPREGAGRAPMVPATDTFLHLAVVPVGDDRIRVAGTAEFTGFDARVTPSRVDNLWRLLTELYPQYAAAVAGCERNGWAGLRPMCPDGVPLIGESGIPGLLLNTGHGHLGWTLAAGSGSLLADIALHRPTAIPIDDYAPRRFAINQSSR